MEKNASSSIIRKPTIHERINGWIGMFIYRRMGVKSGPFMFYSRGEWWFIDHTGSVWIIRYTGRYDGCPLQISLFHKP